MNVFVKHEIYEMTAFLTCYNVPFLENALCCHSERLFDY